MAFCVNCGQQIPAGAKFCPACGTTTILENSNAQYREIVYDGKLHKCPNCGELLSALTVACPACGYEIRGNKASNSIKEFAAHLVDTQNDTKKITLIQSFPIPNTKEDILEFMILASTCFNANEQLINATTKTALSSAWLTKVEQSYQKATLLFSNDADFSKIETVYTQVHSQLKASAHALKKKSILQLLLRTIGLWGGLVLLIIAFIIDISNQSSNTSVFHLGGAMIMIIGALIIGRKNNELTDVGIGATASLLAILLGMLLQEKFDGNGSAMVLGGGITLVIVVIQLVRTSAKK